jgi:outer membrane protein
MLKKILLAAALMTAPVLAQAEGKIAVLNVQEAIMNTDVAKKAFNEWKKRSDIAESVKQLESLQKDYQAAVEKFQKDAAVMSTEAKQEEAKKIQSKRADIEHVSRKLQAAQNELMQELMQQEAPKLQQVVSDMVKSEGIGLLLNRQAVMHVDSSFSITAKVTDKLNQAK